VSQKTQDLLPQHVAQVESVLQRLTPHLARSPSDPGAYIERGMAYFKLGRIAESIHDFDAAERLNPALTPRLWQRGLAYYYAERFAEGAEQFEVDLTVNQHDVEETVWRYLCQAQEHGAQVARARLLPVRHDPRPVMHWIYKLFAGECDMAEFLAQYGTARAEEQFYSALYAGLYCEAIQDSTGARQYIAQAAAMQVVEDYMGWLAIVHHHLRGWDKR
jgi:tetratricopeptide (TPR) repeat protein